MLADILVTIHACLRDAVCVHYSTIFIPQRPRSPHPNPLCSNPPTSADVRLERALEVKYRRDRRACESAYATWITLLRRQGVRVRSGGESCEPLLIGFARSYYNLEGLRGGVDVDRGRRRHGCRI